MPELPEFETIRRGLVPHADARQFGLIDLIRNNTLDEDPRLRGLGVEPLEDAMTDEWHYRAK